jgi:hypothetical protein
MGKALKGVMAVVVILILIVAFAAYYVLGNLDRLVEVAIEKVGPQVTGTPVLVSGVSIALKEGRGEISGLTIGNPDGYQSDHALRIGRLVFDLDTQTITSDPVRITEISVSETDLIAELGPAGLNLKALMDTMNSGGSGQAAEPESTSSGPGLVIDRFDFTGAKMTLETPLKNYDTTVPDVRLTGIGEKEGGATAAEAARQILRPVIAAAIAAAQKEAGAQGLDGYRESAADRVREEANKLKDKLKLGN